MLLWLLLPLQSWLLLLLFLLVTVVIALSVVRFRALYFDASFVRWLIIPLWQKTTLFFIICRFSSHRLFQIYKWNGVLHTRATKGSFECKFKIYILYRAFIWLRTNVNENEDISKNWTFKLIVCSEVASAKAYVLCHFRIWQPINHASNVSTFFFISNVFHLVLYEEHAQNDVLYCTIFCACNALTI